MQSDVLASRFGEPKDEQSLNMSPLGPNIQDELHVRPMTAGNPNEKRNVVDG